MIINDCENTRLGLFYYQKVLQLGNDMLRFLSSELL